MASKSALLKLPEAAVPLLRCPECRESLATSAEGLACTQCKREYAVEGGVAILFDEQTSLYSRGSVSRSRAKQASTPKVKGRIEKLLPDLERNFVARDHAESFARRLLAENPAPMILNIGGKHAGAACLKLRNDPAARVVEMDVRPGPLANLLADPSQIPFADGTFDAVIIDAVLEHVAEPIAVADEIWRVLKPRGMVYSDVPFMLQVHGGSLDFWRFSHVGHRCLFRKFEELESGMSQGPSVALECAILYFWLSFVRGRYARYAVRSMCRLTLFPLKYLDYLLVRKPGAMDAVMGTFFIGRRSEHDIPQRTLLDAYRGASPDLHPVR